MIPWFLMAAAYAGGTAAAQPGEPTRVEVCPVVEEPVAPQIELVGTVLPNRRALLGTEVSGLAVEMPVDAGDRVARGAAVCRLDGTVRRLAFEQAQAELGRLSDVLAELQAGERAEDLARWRAAYDEAVAEVKRWEFEKARLTDLRERGQSTEKEYNDAVTQYAAAEGRMRQAEATWNRGKAGARPEEIAAARHAVEAQKAVAARLAYELDRTTIVSPFDGFVTAKRTEVGHWVEVGAPVVELVELHPARVRAFVPEHVLPFADVGAPATIIIDALGRTLDCRIARVVPDADPRARTFPVEVDLPNEAGQIKPGMFARLRVPSGPATRRLVVPKDALVKSPQGWIVWVVRATDAGDTAAPLPVSDLLECAARTAVTSPGLAAGDRVVVRGNERLMMPGPVVAIPWTETPTSPDAAASQPAADAAAAAGEPAGDA